MNGRAAEQSALCRGARARVDRQSAATLGEGRPDLAVFLPSLRAGGTEKVMTDLARGFVALGYRVDMVLCSAEGHYLSRLPEAVRVIDLKSSRVLRSLWPLARYLRQRRPYAMLSAMTHSNAIAVLASLVASSGARLVLSERSNLTQATNDTSSWRERLLPYFCSLLYNRADRVICVSQGVADDLAASHGVAAEKLVTIPNPIDVEDLANARMATSATDIDEFSAGRRLLVSVGRLDPAKDHATLISAVKLVRESSDVCLAIVGDGPLRDELAQAIIRLELEDCVRLVGFDPLPARWMARCDVYVHSSRREGFPNALVEAMACGAPVVATDCRSGPREILEDNKWGRLVPVGDARALASAICASLESVPNDAAARARQYARETVLSAYLDALGLARELGTASEQ